MIKISLSCLGMSKNFHLETRNVSFLDPPGEEEAHFIERDQVLDMLLFATDEDMSAKNRKGECS